MREVRFTLKFRNGSTYSHSYLVPIDTIEKGEEAVQQEILLQAVGDILYVFVEEE